MAKPSFQLSIYPLKLLIIPLLITLSLLVQHSHFHSISIHENHHQHDYLENKNHKQIDNNNNNIPFTIGTWYGGGKYRAPTMSNNPAQEIDQWKREIIQITQLGFNRIYDTFAIEQLFQIILQNVTTNHLKVIIQIYADSAPSWLGKKFGKEAEFVTSNDVHIQSQSSPGYCFDHPGVRDAMLKFYRAIAEVGQKYEKLLLGFDVWSEPHLVNWVWFNDLSGVQFCYCKHTQVKFRDWLKLKYSNSLNELNKIWYRTYQTWEEVEAPRFGTIISYADYLDWMNFTMWKLADDLKTKGQAVSDVLTSHQNNNKDYPFVLTSHSATASVMGTPLDDYGVPDDFKMSQSLKQLQNNYIDTFYGVSIYPKHAMAPLGGRAADALSFMFEGLYAASQGKGFFVGELQAGQGVTGMKVNVPVTDIDIKNWIWNAISYGAKSIFTFEYYPANSGYESGGYGLINLDGTLTDRAKEAGRMSTIVNHYSKLFMKAQPEKAKIAILYNPSSYFAGGNTIGSARNLRDSLMGIFKAIFPTNWPITFIHVDSLTDINQYQLVYAPFPLVIPSYACSEIVKFINQGGIFVSEARFAWLNQFGNTNDIIPGCSMNNVFNVKEAVLNPLQVSTTGNSNVQSGSSVSSSSSFTFNYPPSIKGLTVTSQLMEENLQILQPSSNTRIWASFNANNATAVVEGSYSYGKTLYIGSFLGLGVVNGDDNAKTAIQEIIRNLLGDGFEFSKISFTSSSGNCQTMSQMRLMTSEGIYIIVGFNRNLKENCFYEMRLREVNSNVSRVINILDNDRNVAFQQYGNQITIQTDINLYQDFEYTFLAETDYPFIIKAFDYFELKEFNNIYYYYVMPYFIEGDLYNFINNNFQDSHIPLNLIFQIIFQINHGLFYMHFSRRRITNNIVVHRDIDLRNIFVKEFIKSKSYIEIVIGDFGHARTVDNSTELMNSEVGKRQYWTPEQIRNEEYDYKTDIWCLGVIFYQLLTKDFNLNIGLKLNGNLEKTKEEIMQKIKLHPDINNENENLN
ncbi:hypothetical protein ABK040_006210 [Willaertia magna]